MKRLVALAISIGIAAASAAVTSARQEVRGTGDRVPGGSVGITASTCDFPFGGSNFIWCISNTGNLVNFVSPAGVQLLNQVDHREGYVLCTPGATYYDLGDPGWNSGWGAPVTLSSGPSTVQIRRTTLDGNFQFDQKWKRDDEERDLTVSMIVKNNTSGTIGPVFLTRWAAMGPDGDAGDDRFDKSAHTGWAGDIHGVTGGAKLGLTHTLWIGHVFFDATCSIQASFPTPGGPGLVYFADRFNLGNMKSRSNRMMRYTYRAR